MARGVSVRRSGDVVKVTIFSDGVIIYTGVVPANDPVKVKRLLLDISFKGVSIPKFG